MSRRSTTGRITAVHRMNGGELVSHAPGEVVTHPVAAPFRSLKASRSFLKTRPVRRTVPETGLAHPRFLAGERERLLFARNQFVEHSRLIPWPGQVAGSPSRGREIEREREGLPGREKGRQSEPRYKRVYVVLTVHIYRPGRDPVRSSGFA